MARRSPQPDGPPPPPTVQKIRLRYAKRGRLRFTSHRDVARVFERAVRRAGLPVAFSAGFSPHPRISWMGAAPTGVASEAEYVEIGLTETLDADDVGRRLDAALPPDLDVLEAVESGPGALADRLEASIWRLALPGVGDPGPAIDAFLAAGEIPVIRRTKDGERTLDARAAVLALRPAGTEITVSGTPCAIVEAVVRHTTPVVRPDDVLTALRAVAALELDAPMVATRLAQGPLLRGEDGTAGGVTDPLEADRTDRVARSGVGVTAGSA
jgi:radical SAM-linked protein